MEGIGNGGLRWIRLIDFKGHKCGKNTREARNLLRKEIGHHQSISNQITPGMTNQTLWFLKIKSDILLFENISKI